MKRAFDYKRLLGSLLMIVVTAIWGLAFVLNKRAVTELPTMYVLTLRFLPAAVLLGLCLIPRYRRLSKGTIWRGFLLGLMLFAAYTVQTFGLRFTTPARNGFLTVTYCVLTPFLVWAIFRTKPKSYNVIAAVLCITGLALVALLGETGSELPYLLGDLLTLLSAVFYALQIIYIPRFQDKKDDALWLLFFELLTVGVLCGLSTVAVELPLKGPDAFVLTRDMVGNLLYLMLASTLFAQLGQMVGQRYTTSSQAAIILSLESVFAAIFSVVMGAEQLSAGLIGGFALIFVAVLMSETKFDILAICKRLLRAKKEEVDAAPETESTSPETGAAYPEGDDLPDAERDQGEGQDEAHPQQENTADPE